MYAVVTVSGGGRALSHCWQIDLVLLYS